MKKIYLFKDILKSNINNKDKQFGYTDFPLPTHSN